ncbi:hypothetical protein [Botrimarina hoheduenensis]|uniref:Uncharacterized protein n=1 Tax=Botrimarina hoheduenensis TaxID=2528000 RepID=A0A5C5VZB2_9BACT|nr:hypothetical protein [Botrimarina hoheduenensis]TWT43119.1 hypothetical protein Pla111_20690 [Botrimarina hoheduenensis]
MILHDLRVDPDERVNVAYYEPYRELAGLLRGKLASIVLGDGRIECDWQQEDDWIVSDFASGAHDRRLVLPTGAAPRPSLPIDP